MQYGEIDRWKCRRISFPFCRWPRNKNTPLHGPLLRPGLNLNLVDQYLLASAVAGGVGMGRTIGTAELRNEHTNEFPKHSLGIWLAAPFRHELAGKEEGWSQLPNPSAPPCSDSRAPSRNGMGRSPQPVSAGHAESPGHVEDETVANTHAARGICYCFGGIAGVFSVLGCQGQTNHAL